MVQMIISAPGEQPLPAVAWNYEEVKAEVEASLAQYKDRAYTPETIGGAKATAQRSISWPCAGCQAPGVRPVSGPL